MDWGFYHFSVKRSVDFTLTRIAGSASSPAQDEAGRGGAEAGSVRVASVMRTVTTQPPGHGDTVRPVRRCVVVKTV